MQRSSPAYVPSVGNPKFAPPPGDYLPDLVQPKVLQLSGMCLPLRPPNEADITFFPPGTVPVNVRMILGCTVPRALIRDPDVVLSRCVPGQTFHLRMMVSTLLRGYTVNTL